MGVREGEHSTKQRPGRGILTARHLGDKGWHGHHPAVELRATAQAIPGLGSIKHAALWSFGDQARPTAQRGL